MLDGIEGATLGGQHGAGIAAQPHERGPGGDLLSFLDENLDLHGRIESAKKSGRHRHAGDGDRVAAVHDAGKARIRGDDAFRGDVMPAARPAFAKVLGEGREDEAFKVEAGNG